MTNTRLVALLFSCILAVTSYGQFSEFAVSNIKESLLEDAHSVKRFDNISITFEDGEVLYDIEYAITVLDQKHSKYLSIGIPYEEGNSKVKNLKIKYLDSNGDVLKKAKPKEIEDRYLHGFELLSGSRFKYYGFETKVYPMTVLVSYQKVQKSTMYIRRWMPIANFGTSVEYSALTIKNIDEAELEIEGQNLDAYGIEVKENRLYSAANLEAVRKEKYMPDLDQLVPNVRVFPVRKKYYNHETTARTWAEVGNWMYTEMFASQQNCKIHELKADLDKVVGSETDQKKIAKKLYKYVQDKTRYVAIMLEDGGYVPLETNIVHTKKYGDCKALSYYYHTLLSLYDIKSDLAFVYAGGPQSDFDETLVTPTYFNHVINQVQIGQQDYWVDCTSSAKPFGFIGDFSDDRQTLIANASGSRIGRTPSYEHRIGTVVEVDLNEEGHLAGTLELSSTGTAIDGKLDYMFSLDDKKTEEYQDEVVFKNINKANVISHRYALDTAALTFVESYEFTTEDAVGRLGSYLTLPVSQVKFPTPRFKKVKKRVWDIEMDRTKNYEAVHVITTPANFLAVVEEDIDIHSDYGSYTYETTVGPQKTVVRRTLKIEKGTFPAAEYSSIKAFFDKIRNAEQRKITYNLKS